MENSLQTATSGTEQAEALPTNESASAPIISLSNIGKWYPTKEGPPAVVVKGIDLEVPAKEGGQIVVLLGPSGCGKSTILHMVSGLLSPDEGEVRLFGRPVTGPARETVTVPQAYTCYPWLSALANVRFGLAVDGKSRREQTQIATEYLNKVGLGNRLGAMPGQLSGGMQQRVAIARTLAMKPPIVLMDEPFGALDAQTRGGMQQMLVDLWTEERNTILFVTHDISEALLLADRVIVFSTSPARIVFDRQVPFSRPRQPSLVTETEFIVWSQTLLQALKGTDVNG